VGTDLSDLGSDDCILVVGTDLHEEAPIWWLRIKQAAARGAKLIVANARATRLDAYATHVLRYGYGSAAQIILGMQHAVKRQKELAAFASEGTHEAGQILSGAANAIVFFGNEGMNYAASHALAQACASLLAATDHIGRVNNGLVPIWPHSNTQGAWDMGVVPEPAGLTAALDGKKAVYIMAADPLGDDPALAKVMAKTGFVVVQELFLTETAKAADVVLPAQSFAEREGTYTNAMRRVQRFYPAIPPFDGARADWEIITAAGRELGFDMMYPSAAALMVDIAATTDDYSDITYPALSRSEKQWPPVGEKDLYFGGTAYANHQGLGLQLAPRATDLKAIDFEMTTPPKLAGKSKYMIVPITKLLDHGITVAPSQVLASRLEPQRVYVNPDDAKTLNIRDGGEVEVRWNGSKQRLPAVIEMNAPKGFAMLPRSLGVPLSEAASVEISPIGR